MNDWQTVTLEDVMESINTGLDAIRRAPIVEHKTNLRCLRIQDISQNKPFDKWGYTEVKDSDFKKFQLVPNDIIMARTCSTGICYLVKKELPAVFNNGLARIRLKIEKVDPKFIYYVFKSKHFSGYIDGISGGTSVQLNMKIGDLLKYQFNLPPLSEQKEIARILSDLDKKIELNTQINQTLEQIAQALFKSWFVDFDPVRAKVQVLSDGFSLEQAELAAMQAISGKTPEELTALSQIQPERYAELAETAKAFPCEMVEVDGVEVPKGWEVLNANDVIEFNPKEPLKKDTLAYYLDMASLPTQGCSPDLPTLRKFTSGTRFRNGDTLFARITPCLENGKTAFIQYLPEGTVAWGSTEYIVMRTKGIIPKPYSYLLARYEAFRKYAIRSMTGTSGRQRTQLDIIETYKVVSPSDNKLWESFSKIINPIFETINSNTNKNITLANIRDLLLPKLLNREI